MILPVDLPHSGYDEEDYFATLEAARDIMGEGKKLGAVDFLIGGDINIELKLELGDVDLQGLNGFDWYGIYGSGCLGGGEDVMERKFHISVSVQTGRVIGVTTMRLVAWRLCRRGWKELLWRSRLLQWHPGTRASSWCLKRSGNWRVGVTP